MCVCSYPSQHHVSCASAPTTALVWLFAALSAPPNSCTHARLFAASVIGQHAHQYHQCHRTANPNALQLKENKWKRNDRYWSRSTESVCTVWARTLAMQIRDALRFLQQRKRDGERTLVHFDSHVIASLSLLTSCRQLSQSSRGWSMSAHL